MTVPLGNRMDYTGNGAVDTYAYTFKIFEDSELLVTVADTDGAETTLVLTTDYTVTGAGSSSGGNVVLVNASQAWLDSGGDLLTGYHLTIRRVLDLTQETDLPNQGSFFAEVHEDQFDRLVMIAQQQQDQIERGIRLPETVSSATFDPELPPSIVGEAGAILKVNSDGDGWTVGTADLPDATVTPYMETVLDDLDAAAARATLGALEDGTSTVDATNLAPDSVTTVKILNSNVTTAKIADGNVTLAKISEAALAGLSVYGGVVGGTADAMTLTVSPAFTSYAAGMTLVWRATAANTTAVTLNVNGLGAKNLYDCEAAALSGAEIQSGMVLSATYDGTQFILHKILARTHLRVNTGAGHGSTNTRIRRIETSEVAVGTSATVSHSATAGTSFTIVRPGLYAIGYGDSHSGNAIFGISLNSAQLTTTIASITATNRLSISSVSASFNSSASVRWLSAGDVVRPHTDAGPTSTDAVTYFDIQRIR